VTVEYGPTGTRGTCVGFLGRRTLTAPAGPTAAASELAAPWDRLVAYGCSENANSNTVAERACNSI
jgi:hypothetical protein